MVKLTMRKYFKILLLTHPTIELGKLIKRLLLIYYRRHIVNIECFIIDVGCL